MNTSGACVDEDRLRDHLDGALAAEEAAAVIAHLDLCARCQETLETLVDDGGLTELARSAGRAAAESTALISLLTKLKREPFTDETPTELPDELGQYRVLEVAGRGGMGVAFRALDKKLGRIVCLKVFTGSQLLRASARQRMLREARAAAAIDSEHVVKIYAVEEEAQPPYLAMEFVAGDTLQALLDEGPLPIARVLEIGEQVAAGLTAAHAQGVVHRDIKPGNILIEAESGRVKIMDFGLARASDDCSLTTEGAICGTPEYMAPEQVRGDEVDARADLFSLGTLLYAMCIGRTPFRADNSLAVLRRILDDTPRRLDRLRGDVPAELASLVRRLHAKQPERRIQSADEVRKALAEIASGAFRPPRIARRAWLLGVGGVLLGGVAVATAWNRRIPAANALPLLDRQIRNRPVVPARDQIRRVLIVLPPKDFFAPDYFPVAVWLGSHNIKFQVASTDMGDCQPDARSKRIADGEGRDVSVRPDLLIQDARASEYDAIYFVGGVGALIYGEGGSHAEFARKLIQEFLHQGKLIAAMGIAPIVLAEAGVLEGRKSACYPFGEPHGVYIRRLEEAGAKWTDEPVVNDGPFLTCGNPRFIEEFGEALVKRLGVEPRDYLLPVPGD